MTSNTSRRFIPLPQWNDYHPWPTIGGLRWMVFNAKDNGLEHCLRRVGNRILIDETAFWEWVDQQKAT